MRVFLDTNVIMDILVAGRPSSEASAKVAGLNLLGGDNDFRFCVSALSIADVVYSARKYISGKELMARVDWMRRNWKVLELSVFNIYNALESKCPDFEDAMQISIAESDCDVIVTNNTKHFKGYTALEVVTPQEFLDHVRA